MAALALLMSLSAAQGRSQSPPTTSAEPKPASSDHAQPSEQTAGPAGSPAAAPTPENITGDQIEADIKKLHLLAAELRAEVGRTYKESLSVDVLKKAKEIETLSKSLKERIDQKEAAARHR